MVFHWFGFAVFLEWVAMLAALVAVFRASARLPAFRWAALAALIALLLDPVGRFFAHEPRLLDALLIGSLAFRAASWGAVAFGLRSLVPRA
jgi:hypothetical protein